MISPPYIVEETSLNVEVSSTTLIAIATVIFSWRWLLTVNNNFDLHLQFGVSLVIIYVMCMIFGFTIYWSLIIFNVCCVLTYLYFVLA